MTVIRGVDNFEGLKVSSDGRAQVDAVIESELEKASEKGDAFMAYSSYSLTGGEEAFYLENEDSTRDIRVEYIEVSTSASGIASVMEKTGGTPAGTVVTPVNLHLGSSKGSTSEFTVLGNASVTGSVVGDTISAHDLATSGPWRFFFEGGLILPKNSGIFVRFATTGVVHVACLFHFSPKSPGA